MIALLGNISHNHVTMKTDDGKTQTVEVRKGITLRAHLDVPNPIKLLDVEQPESLFILRLKERQDAITAALFEADGGNWRLEAIHSIASWLEERIPGMLIVA